MNNVETGHVPVFTILKRKISENRSENFEHGSHEFNGYRYLYF